MRYPHSASRADGPRYLLGLTCFSNPNPECSLRNYPGQIYFIAVQDTGRLFYTTLLFHSLIVSSLPYWN